MRSPALALALVAALLLGGVARRADQIGLLYSTVTPFVLSGAVQGTTRTPVFIYPLQDSTLGPSRVLRVTVTGTIISTGAGGTLTPYLMFGGTTYWSDTISVQTTNGDATGTPFQLIFTIRNTTSQSAQLITGSIWLSILTVATGTGDGVWAAAQTMNGGILKGITAINTASGGPDTVQVDFQLPIAAASDVLTVDTAMIELL